MNLFKIIQGWVRLKGNTDGSFIGNTGDRLRVVSEPELTHQIDSFGRQRVSNPTNIFEYTFKYDIDFDAYWSTATTSGGSVSHNSDRGTRVLSITSASGSKSSMQLRRRLQYYAGKSHLFHFSANFKGAESGVRKCLGLYDSENGFFFQADNGTLSVVIRSKTTGSVVDTVINQQNWNGDKVDGTGASGVTADPSKNQLFWIDYAWLGAAGVRFGIYAGGNFITLHTEVFANITEQAYTQTANLPYRIEIENIGGGPASTFETTCLAFEVEGNASLIGKVRPYYEGNTAVTVSSEEVIGIYRINPLYKNASSKFERVNLVIETGSDELVTRVYQNPTITGGAISWVDVPGSIMQAAQSPSGQSINTSSGFVSGLDVIRTDGELRLQESDLFFGFDLNDNPDVLVITTDSINGSADVLLNVLFREFY